MLAAGEGRAIPTACTEWLSFRDNQEILCVLCVFAVKSEFMNERKLTLHQRFNEQAT
jgi:hypothetical protein